MLRWIALAAFAGSVGISVYYRRRARREGETIPRRREAAPLLVGRALAALPLFGAVLTYLLNPAWMAWASLPLPGWLRAVGAVTGLLTVPAAYWVFSSLGRQVSETVLTKQQHELVTTGPYRWIRHPLYATGSTLFLAIGLMAANWFILLFAFLALVGVRLVVIPLEERELVGKFGDRYRAYMRRTGALVPRLRDAREDGRAG